MFTATAKPFGDTRTMINTNDIHYVGLTVTDVEASRRRARSV
jgi:hypothetical protein